jgi:ceramide glucosyltransferase
MIAQSLAVAAAALLVVHLLCLWIFSYRLRGKPQPSGVIGQPFVTLLRPVCGVDAFDRQTLASSFEQDYPRYEIIFCARSADDPAVALVRELMAQHPTIPARLLIGHDPISGNPKLNNVWKGWHAAQSDWVCMTDSNLMLPRDYLAKVVAAWGPVTGLVSSPPVGTHPENFGGRLECAFLNSNQAVLQGAAAEVGPAYAQGKTLFFNKPLMEHAGGLRALGRALAEDVAATKAIRNVGREVTLTHVPFAQPIGRRSLRQVWERQLRWSRVRRDGFALIFMMEILNGAAMPALIATLALYALGADPLLALWYLALWYGAEIALARRAGWSMGPLDAVSLILRDLMIPAIWVATFLRRGFEWRGTAMSVPDEQTRPAFASATPLALRPEGQG